MRWAFIALLALAGCEAVDLERMIEQRSYRAYDANPSFDDGMAMRHPPEGTVARETVVGPPELVDGVVDGHWVAQIPVSVDRALLERGRDRFRVFCATCHGIRGDGESQVAENMVLVPPPSLHRPEYRAHAPGRLYGVVRDGYGLMPSYAAMLSVRDRWAVVAYVQALQLSRRAELADLPERMQKEAAPWLE